MSDRLENGAERADNGVERVSEAKDRIIAAGRVGLIAANEFTVGATILTAGATAKGYRKIDSAFESGIQAGHNELVEGKDAAVSYATDKKDAAIGYMDSKKDAAKDTIVNKWTAAESKAGEIGTSLENGITRTIEFGTGVREKLKASREAAKIRRAERREKWKTTYTNGRDTVKSGIESTKDTVRTVRTIGRTAMETRNMPLASSPNYHKHKKV